jgi:hypothetical protein
VPSPLDALVGVYFFPDAETLRTSARDALAAKQRAGGRRTELIEILERVRAQATVRVFPAGEWLDCGNADYQAKSHRILLQKREFNELTIDPVMGTITKRSRNVEKFIDEINYVRLLPGYLSILFPRVIDYSVEWKDPWLVSEYYGYPTLADIFVFENADPGIWERVFIRLRDIIQQGFMRSARPLTRGSIEDMYLTKTRARVEQLAGPPELLRLVAHDGPVTVNGRPLANLPQLWPRIEAEVARLAAAPDGSIVHGDLCFSNILYDLRLNICKLIDPRGSFGKSGLFGDVRYDIAKLYHSVRGLYDFITNDLFRISVDGTSITLEIRTRAQHDRILERFERTFFGVFDKRDVTLITALLFVSMPALHYDYPRRQLAMYTTALLLFDEVFSSSAGSAGRS